MSGTAVVGGSGALGSTIADRLRADGQHVVTVARRGIF